jgi:hypothetical protein
MIFPSASNKNQLHYFFEKNWFTLYEISNKKNMTVVSTKEFNSHQEQFFDLAMSEQVYIQRDNCMFIVARAIEPIRKYKEPDDDLRSAITMQEAQNRVIAHIRQKHTN